MRIYIPIKPKAAPRPRVTTNGTYNPKEYTRYKRGVATVARAKCKRPFEGPVAMRIEFFFKVPKSWPKKRKAEAKWHTNKPDIDNLQKAIKDALNGIAYRDDSQVCQVMARKQYAQSDGMMIEIEEIE